MVSVTQIEGERTLLKQNAGSEQTKFHQGAFRGNLSGIRTHLYLLGAQAKCKGASGGFSCPSEGQSLLEALVLSQWEDRSWKGQVRYDVTCCEIKVISGGKKFIAQMNEKWNSNTLREFENKAFHSSGHIKSSYMRAHSDDILLCVASGEKESSEIIPSILLPKDGTLAVINANPIEYGHIFLVPYGIHRRPHNLDKKTIEMIGRMAAEINSSSFRVFFDYNASMNSDLIYFQACYFALPLLVELLPTALVYGSTVNKGLVVCELSDYPLNALVFMSKNLNVLAGVVAEICSTLQDHNTAFSLLISDCGKMFLFPQVHPKGAEHHLPSWECGGYFICNTRSGFDGLTEAEILERMASVSIDNKGFQALKKICCDIVVKFAP